MPMPIDSTACRRKVASWLPALLLLVCSGPANADWLVTVEGDRIETRGPWRVEGSRVVFEAANGALTAMRVSTIDFDATDAYAAKLAAPAPEVVAPRVEPVLVLTESDVPRARTVEPLAEGAEDGTADGTQDGTQNGTAETAQGGATTTGTAREGSQPAAARAATASADVRVDLPGVVVSSWQERESTAGLRFSGSLANDSRSFATMLRVEAAVYDETGGLLETRTASLARSSISPGRSTTFDVSFPGVFSYGEVRFTPAGVALTDRDSSTGSSPADGDDSTPPPR
ncbi:MAG TPA: hypothetical protein VNB06_18600 [Thermoanaerobaculia bacterium]|nr:hypothetical protein [Thermoanaerobaculia bacterium]